MVLERRSTLGGGWQDRWEEFRLVTPNWTASFPDAPYDGDDPDGYMPRDELVARVSRYADTIAAPVMLEAGVERMGPHGDAWQVDTAQGRVLADNVIVATGGFGVPRIPPVSDELPADVLQLHAHHYRREADLPPGAVLVVGSGQTGVQLTEELLEAGREVYLCVGSAGRVPRRYRGRDIFHWLSRIAEDGASLGTRLADRLGAARSTAALRRQSPALRTWRRSRARSARDGSGRRRAARSPRGRGRHPLPPG